jgi:mono/diheme cytochrome c family protein
MRPSRTLLGLGLLVAGLLGAARTSDGAPQALAGDPVAGQATFTQHCSICHGVAAQGFIGPHIAGINWTAAGLRGIVRHGVGGYGGMPAFNAAVVTDKNIADIAAFLAPPATPKPAVVAAASAAPSLAPASAAPVAASGAGDPVHGRAVYSANCAACHGANAEGGFGPTLRGEKNRKDAAAANAWIKNPKLPMPKLYPDPLSAKDVDDVTAYIESI